MKVFVADPTSYLGKNVTEAFKGGEDIELLEVLTEADVKKRAAKAARAAKKKSKDNNADGKEGENEEQGGEEEGKKGGEAGVVRDLMACLAEAEVIIIDLVEKAEASTEIIQALSERSKAKRSDKLAEDDEEEGKDKIVIGVSSVLTWAVSATEKKKALAESDWKTRKPSNNAKEIKMLETSLISMQTTGLTTFVVAAGLLYGKGEKELASLFQDAWMCERSSLPCIGEGSNFIPTIHVKDLSAVIYKIATGAGKKQYVVAVNPAKVTQRQIVQAVASSGLGQVETVPLDDERVTSGALGNVELRTADIKFSSKLFINSLGLEWHSENGFGVNKVADEEEDAPAEEAPEGEEGDETTKAEKDVADDPAAAAAKAANFEKVRKEFIAAKRLNPVRVVVHGPPASGKSYFCAMLAENYHVPHIRLGDIIAETLSRGDLLSETIRNSFVRPPTGDADSEQNAAPANRLPKDPRARIPASFITKLVKQKLRSAPCRNKGYILDGYPRTLEEANALFLPDNEGGVVEDVQQEEENLEDKPEGDAAPARALDESTRVDFVIQLDCSKEKAIQRSQALSQTEYTQGHNDPASFERRWNFYSIVNLLNVNRIMSPIQFYKDLEILDISEAATESSDLALEIMKNYVEQRGKPFNFHPTLEEVASKERAANQEEQVRRELAEKNQALKEKTEARERKDQKAVDEQRMADVLKDDKEAIQIMSQPLRKYLMVHVVPALIDGLQELIEAKPVDPIDHLAEFLFKQSVGARSDFAGEYEAGKAAAYKYANAK